MKKLSLIIVCCLSLYVSGNAMQFGQEKRETKIDWNYKNGVFHFKIQANGFEKNQTNKNDNSIKTSYGLVLAKEKSIATKDSVCLTFDINNDGETFYNILIDYEGNVKGIYTNRMDWVDSWNIDLKANIKKKSGSWSAILDVPATAFNCKPGNKDIWKIAFGRKLFKGNKAEYNFSEKDTYRLSYGPSLDRNGWSKLPIPREKIILSKTDKTNYKVICRTRGACDIKSQDEIAFDSCALLIASESVGNTISWSNISD